AVELLTQYYEYNYNKKQIFDTNLVEFYNKTKEYNWSCHYFAYMHDIGQGIDQDYNKAIELYNIAIDKDNVFSVSNLAVLYINGEGIEKNYYEAIKLLKIAIDKGSISSIHYLAKMYENGKYVEKNYNKAIELYNIAIDK